MPSTNFIEFIGNTGKTYNYYNSDYYNYESPILKHLPDVIDKRFTLTFSIYHTNFHSTWRSVIRITDDYSNSYSSYR